MNSIAFLEAFHPRGPWVLTAIRVDRKGIKTETFGPKSKDKAEAWVKKHESKQNLYFSVNLPAQALTKKAEREEIDIVPWLHVDIDARAGEDLAEELERIKALLTVECPVLPPTFIVFSGGGYQAFWQLKEPLQIKGELQAAEDASRYNKQLEIVLGGDNCSNIDRIMRLPGTMNIPGAKKIAKGRTPVLAEVFSYHPENIYDISQFIKAPAMQTDRVDPGMPDFTTANLERLASIDELDRWNVPDRVKVVLVQGHDPDNPKPQDNSRSAWLFDACCQLLRADVPKETVLSIITDPDFGISASVLDKGSNATKYAWRQIKRAEEEVEEPWLRKLNDKFAVIGNLGGKCRVIEEIYDSSMSRTVFSKQTFGDFRNRYSNIQISVGRRTTPLGNWWLNNPHRRQFEYLLFAPGRHIEGAYNLWQGFACPSLPGEKHELYLEHIRHNICCDVEMYFDYLIGWMARAVQFPASPGESAVVMRGASGVGKSFFAKQFGRIWGRHFLQVSDAKHLVGNFNAHLRDCVILFGDEAFFAGDRRHESVLKTLITEEQMMIEQKGVDAEVSPNYTHLILASNSAWVIPAGATERRFFVLDVGSEHQKDTAYFRAIDHAMSNGGAENLLHFLLSYDLTDYDVRRVPATPALLEQKIHSMGPEYQWWMERLTEGTLLSEQARYERTVVGRELVDDYVQTCVRYNVTRRGSTVKLGMFLEKVCPPGWPKRGRRVRGGSREHFYEFPDLYVLRDTWDQLFGLASPWPEDDEGAEQTEAPF